MTIKQLKEITKDVPDDYTILLNLETPERGYLQGPAQGVWVNKEEGKIKLTCRQT